jgi:uncharacterized membrane protein
MNQKDEWHNDPANWTLGIFYFNRRDNRLLVPKRNKWLGFTINWAHPLAIVFFGAIIAFICLLGTRK